MNLGRRKGKTLRRRFSFLLFALLLPGLWGDRSFAGSARGAGPASADTTTLHEVSPPLPVPGAPADRAIEGGRTDWSGRALAIREGGSVADLGSLLPASRGITNSRGEDLFMVRGAPERHLPLFIDGVPLVIPWDERVDLSMVPALALGGLSAVRGTASLLDGPHALAGVIRLHLKERRLRGGETAVALRAGEGNVREASLLHLRRSERWRWLAAFSRSDRDAWLVPSSWEGAFHQEAGRSRTNSDRERTSLVLRAAREAQRSSFRLFFLGSDGEKGVPPEAHIGEARFWRYPRHRRALFGLSLRKAMGGKARWEVEGIGSADFFEQEIREYDDATYQTPALEEGVSFERDRDRTGTLCLTLRRRTGRQTGLVAGGKVRHTRHREVLEVGGPAETYVQIVRSASAEWTAAPAPGWRLRLGAGYEGASTPESGDKPARDGTGKPVFHGRVDRSLGGAWSAYASASRLHRFPSLRELFSGALGRFVPNPDLGPESQNLYEAGLVFRRKRTEFSFTGFVSYLEGGIEKVVLAGEPSRFQRANVDEIRTLGAELLSTIRPATGVRIDADHTMLLARRKEAGGFREPVEDRPDYLTHLSADWTLLSGWTFQIETVLTGPRHSADWNDSDDGLTRLPAEAIWSGRFGYFQNGIGGSPVTGELYLRVHNLFDQAAYSQVGLPQPGRTVWLGLRLFWEG